MKTMWGRIMVGKMVEKGGDSDKRENGEDGGMERDGGNRVVIRRGGKDMKKMMTKIVKSTGKVGGRGRGGESKRVTRHTSRRPSYPSIEARTHASCCLLKSCHSESI
jgi:hypothetical protein